MPNHFYSLGKCQHASQKVLWAHSAAFLAELTAPPLAHHSARGRLRNSTQKLARKLTRTLRGFTEHFTSLPALTIVRYETKRCLCPSALPSPADKAVAVPIARLEEAPHPLLLARAGSVAAAAPGAAHAHLYHHCRASRRRHRTLSSEEEEEATATQARSGVQGSRNLQLAREPPPPRAPLSQLSCRAYKAREGGTMKTRRVGKFRRSAAPSRARIQRAPPWAPIRHILGTARALAGARDRLWPFSSLEPKAGGGGGGFVGLQRKSTGELEGWWRTQRWKFACLVMISAHFPET